MTIHRVIDPPFRDGGGNAPVAGTPLDRSHPICIGLSRYWLANQGGGAQVADLWHENNHGAFKGTNTTWPGGPGWAFNGTTAYATSLSDLGTPGLLSRSFPYGSAAVMCWFYPTATAAGTLIGKWDHANGVLANQKFWWLLQLTATGKATWRYNSNDSLGDIDLVTSSNTYNLNKWNFVVASFTNSPTSAVMSIALNGTVVTANVIDFSEAPGTAPALLMGADLDTGSATGRENYYTGRILACALWNRGLTLDEQKQLYQVPWSIFLESNVRRWYQTTTIAPCPPLVPRVPDPLHAPDRLVHFTQIVGTILNSLLSQCQIMQTGQGTFSIDAAAVFGNAAVTSFNTRTGAVTLQATDMPLFTSVARGAVPPSGGGTANFIRADGTWAAPVGNITSVSNSDGTLTISPTTGLVVASLNLGHANTWTASQTIDATHHLFLAEMTPGSILYAGASGQVSQDNARIFWDSTNHRFGLFTNSPSFPVDSQISQLSGVGWNIHHTQTQANSTDTGDAAFSISYDVNTSSATNELVATGFSANTSNTLTGGGHIQTYRSFIVVHYSNTGTTTDLWDVFSVDVGNNAGTVTTMTGFHILALQGTTQVGIQVNTLGGTNSAAFLEGSGAPSGAFGVYIGDNVPSYFNGWVREAQGRARVTVDVNNATNSFSNLSDLSLTLVAGRNYIGRMVLKCINTTSGEGIKFDFNGGGATMTNFWAGVGVLTVGGTNVAGANISTSLAGVIGWSQFTGETVVTFEISLTCNAAGTFIPRFAENSGHVSGTATVRLGSWILLEDSPN